MQSAVKRYYNINKILMSKLGSWPAQSIFMKILMPTIAASLIFSIGFLEIVKLSQVWREITEDCETYIITLLALGAYGKLFIVVMKNKEIEELLSLIDHHWRVFTHSLEVQVMHEYAIVGRKLTIGYSVMIGSLATLFMMVPLIPFILDHVMPLNESRPYLYLFDVDFGFDRDTYYFFVLIHAYLIVVVSILGMIITDTSYMMFAQHACSLFAAIGYRLENLTTISSKKSSRLIKGIEVTCNKCELTNYDDNIYHELILILQKHQISLDYVDMLESLFVFYSFIMITFQLIGMSLIGLQIISFMNNKAVLIRYAAMGIGGFGHLFILSYPGQKITDHSADIFHKAYNMMWYETSQKTIRLLSILLYRSFEPCTLTAGKIYVLSMKNYASVTQATLSYFTALTSFK